MTNRGRLVIMVRKEYDDIFTYAERCYDQAGDQFPTCLQQFQPEAVKRNWENL